MFEQLKLNQSLYRICYNLLAVLANRHGRSCDGKVAIRGWQSVWRSKSKIMANSNNSVMALLLGCNQVRMAKALKLKIWKCWKWEEMRFEYSRRWKSLLGNLRKFSKKNLARKVSARTCSLATLNSWARFFEKDSSYSAALRLTIHKWNPKGELSLHCDSHPGHTAWDGLRFTL